MANNPPPYNRSIFNDPLLTNPGNSPFPDTDTHNLFATGFNPPQQLMLNPNGLNQMPSTAHDINSLINQQNPQTYNPLTPKPSIGNGQIGQPPIPIHGSIFSPQHQLPPLLNLNNFQPNSNQIPTYQPSGIGQVPTQIIQPIQPMMHNPPPQYMNSPYMMEMLRRNMQPNNGMNNNSQTPVIQSNMNKQQVNPMMMRLFMRPKPSQSSHSRKRSGSSRKGFISEDNDSEMAEDAIGSSDERSASGSSDETDFENYPDNWVPTDIDGQKRSSHRENIKGVQHDEDVVYYNGDEEESETEIEPIPTQDLIEHIYMERITPEGIEYLVRFQESPPALCSWVPEVLINVIPNAKPHLDRFNNHPTIIDEDVPETSKFITPIAHRRESSDARPELLFRYFKDDTVLFYWDFGKEEVVKNYFDHRTKIYPTHPSIPSMLPEADENIAVSKSDTINLRPLQAEGVNWLVQCWKNQHGSVLADEKGLGKTVQVLGFLSYLSKYTDWHGPILIAVRDKSFNKWSNAIENWTNLNYVPYNSGPAQRSIMREYQFQALDDCGEPIPETFGFNIFLVTYDVLMKDLDFIQKTNWQILIADEGHRLKNKNGKKHNALSSIPALHRIIITSSPIQRTLGEFWTLLRFVSPNQFQEESPDFLNKDIQDLTKTQFHTLCERFKGHILRRLIQDEGTVPPKDEKIAFVSLTSVQRDLIRLTKLDQLWRLKGIPSSDEEIKDAELKICSHPFLIPNAEKYYTEKLKMRRPDLLLYVSTKFQWLEHILPILKREGQRVLLFCQNSELRKILNEFCASHFWPPELLIDSMSDSDKQSAIARFATDPNKFIFLISTKDGFDSLNLPFPHTAIIFDPDWDPQTSLQIQTLYSSSQTNRVDVYRLITFQTYEHKAFVLSQKKLGLWLILLRNKTTDEFNQSNNGIIPLKAPPIISNVPLDENQSLDLMLDSVSTVVRDFSLDCLESLREPLRLQINTSNGMSDTEFLEQFPVHQDNGLKHLNRNRTRDPLLDIDSSNKIYDLMLTYGYGEWNRIAAELPEHSSEQIRRFGISLCIFAFRAMKPSNITYLPVLVKTVLAEEPDFEFEKLLCSNKHQWATQVFSDEHDYLLEVDSCKKLKDKLHENAFSFLSVIEMRLIAKIWSQRFPSKPFDIDSIAPPAQDSDKEKLNSILHYHFFDPFDLRVQAIIDKMRYDLILSQASEDIAQTYSWWTRIEFDALMSVLKNFQYDPSNPLDFHAKTTIMTKRTEQVIIFVTRLINMLEDRTKGSLLIPKDMHLMKEAPKTLQTAKGFTAWINILVRECDDLAYRTELINLILKKIDELPDAEPPVEGWGDYHTKKFLRLLIQYGIDSLTDLLRDRRFEFKDFLTQSDIDFLMGKKKRRVASTSKLPEFVFNEDELYAFVRGDLDPFVKEQSDDGYQLNDDSENPTITIEDYQLSSDDDDVTGVSNKNISYQFDDSFTTSDNESPTDEEQDDFRPDDE